mgnify:FL=1
MIKIELKIVDIEDVQLKKLDKKPYIFTRIFALVGYKKKDGSLFIRRTVVDTGAVVSLLPMSIWKQLDIKFFGYHIIKGVVKRESCSIPVKTGFIETKVIDEQNETPTFTSLVYCADSNEVPLILGIKDALDKFKIEINVKQKQSYLIYLD